MEKQIWELEYESMLEEQQLDPESAWTDLGGEG